MSQVKVDRDSGEFGQHEEDEVQTKPIRGDKKGPSYYWEDKSKPFFQGIEKPVTTPLTVSSDTISPLKANATGKGSAWNTAGTWEEKHLNVKDLEEVL